MTRFLRSSRVLAGEQGGSPDSPIAAEEIGESVGPCPHLKGEQGTLSGTCTRNGEHPIHPAVQQVLCLRSRHTECPVFSGDAQQPLSPERRFRRRLRTGALVAVVAAVIAVAGLLAVSSGVLPVPGGETNDDLSAFQTRSEPAPALDDPAPYGTIPAPPIPVETSAETTGPRERPDFVPARTTGAAVVPFPDPPAAYIAGLLRLTASVEPDDSETPADEPPSEPEPAPDLVAASGIYVVETAAGLGVSHRDDCRSDAKIPSNGWLEGTRVELVGTGANRCEGWVLVQADGLASWLAASWIRPA